MSTFIVTHESEREGGGGPMSKYITLFSTSTSGNIPVKFNKYIKSQIILSESESACTITSSLKITSLFHF